MNYDKVKPDKIPDNYFKGDSDKTTGIMDENVENFVSVRDLTTNGDLMLISGNTLISYLYDIYDNNLNIKKRYLIPAQSHQVSQGILLKTLYVNNKIYEIYSFGEETPSIMIAEIA